MANSEVFGMERTGYLGKPSPKHVTFEVVNGDKKQTNDQKGLKHRTELRTRAQI